MNCLRFKKKLWERPEDLDFEELLFALLFCSFGNKKATEITKNLAKLARTEKGLMYLDPETIISINGIGEGRTSVIMAAIELARRQYQLEWPKGEQIKLSNLARHLKCRLEGLGREYFYLFSFNRSFGLIQEHLLARGGADAVNVYFRDIIKVLVNDRASQALIAHNHPDESAKASLADLQSMQKLKKVIGELGIILIDQYIVGLDGIYSCKEVGFLKSIAA